MSDSKAIPCYGFYRGCHPGLEYCTENIGYCVLKTWIILALCILITTSILAVFSTFYFVLRQRSSLILIGVITFSILTFLLLLGLIINLSIDDLASGDVTWQILTEVDVMQVF